MNYLKENCTNSLINFIDKNKSKLENLINSYGIRRFQDLVFQNYQLLDDYSLNLNKNFIKLIQRKSERLNHLKKVLDTLNPDHVLRRGYSITRFNNEAITDLSNLKKGDIISSELYQGKIKSKVEETNGK